MFQLLPGSLCVHGCQHLISSSCTHPFFDNHPPNLQNLGLLRCLVDFTSQILTSLTDLFVRDVDKINVAVPTPSGCLNTLGGMPSLRWVTLFGAISRYLSCHPSQCVGYAHYRRSISRVCYIGQTLNHVSWLRSEAALRSCSARVWPTTTVGHYRKEDWFMGNECFKSSSYCNRPICFCPHLLEDNPAWVYKGERILETTILTPFGCTFRTDVLQYDLPPAVDQPWSWSGSLPADSWQFPRFREFGKVVCGERLSAQATVPPFTTGESIRKTRKCLVTLIYTYLL